MGDAREPESKDAPSPDPSSRRQAAMSLAVLREVKSKLDSAVIRLEAVQKDRREPAITRAVDLLLQAERELSSVEGGSADVEEKG